MYRIHKDPFPHIDCDQEGYDLLLSVAASDGSNFLSFFTLDNLFGTPIYVNNCPATAKALEELVRLSEEAGLYDVEDLICQNCGRHLPCRHCDDQKNPS